MINFPRHTDWYTYFQSELTKPYFKELSLFLERESQTKTILPPSSHIFRAFELTSLAHTKVVILGQDPYHGLGEATGLAFAYSGYNKLPPTLKNIIKELHTDLKLIADPNLVKWATEGVLLLNTVLTVEKDKANSHKNKGWEQFTDMVISTINSYKKNVVFLLWGNHAIQKKSLIDNSRHHIIESAHPSPLSAHRGFIGSRPFSKTNEYLLSKGIKPIEWA
jgi:uracil-DNA glycosylase